MTTRRISISAILAITTLLVGGKRADAQITHISKSASWSKHGGNNSNDKWELSSDAFLFANGTYNVGVVGGVDWRGYFQNHYLYQAYATAYGGVINTVLGKEGTMGEAYANAAAWTGIWTTPDGYTISSWADQDHMEGRFFVYSYGTYKTDQRVSSNASLVYSLYDHTVYSKSASFELPIVQIGPTVKGIAKISVIASTSIGLSAYKGALATVTPGAAIIPTVTLSASVDVAFASAGIKGNVQMARLDFGSSVAGQGPAPTGKFWATMTPFSANVVLWGELFGRREEKTLFRYSADAVPLFEKSIF